jgi:hypothetical protein
VKTYSSQKDNAMRNYILIKIAIIAVPTIIAVYAEYYEHKQIKRVKAQYIEQIQNAVLASNLK